MNCFKPGFASRLLQIVPDFVALFVDGGNRQPSRYPQSHERRLGKLQARFDGFRNGIRCAERIEV